jgi:cell division protein FtsI (penicillin-binding protein 3)
MSSIDSPTSSIAQGKRVADMWLDCFVGNAVRVAVLFGCTLVLPTACATPATPKSLATAPVVAPSAKTPPMASGGGSTIDPRLQTIADDELGRALAEWHAAAGTVLVMDPSTGEILADAGRARGAAADVAVRSAYVTGSTIKAITLAAALEEGVLSPTESFDCEHGAWTYGGEVLHDPNPYGVLTVSEILAVSSNIGFVKVFDRLGGSRLSRWLHAFHFGVAPSLEGANAGSMPERIEDRTFAGGLAAIGEIMTASPLQVAAAYGALANGGVYVPPTLSRRRAPVPRESILRPETARTVVGMLEDAVSSDRGTGSRARIAGAKVAGKTGTAGWDLPGGGEGVYASFVGFVPSTAPRFVILVGLEQPQGEDANGPTAAAPVFARVASRAIAP